MDYQWFARFTAQKVSFVTRLRPKSVYSVLKINDTRNIQGVIADEVIQLDSEHAKKRGAPKLRRVEYYDANTKKTFQFLTNHFQLAASTIAAIYKDRWQLSCSLRR